MEELGDAAQESDAAEEPDGMGVAQEPVSAAQEPEEMEMAQEQELAAAQEDVAQEQELAAAQEADSRNTDRKNCVEEPMERSQQVDAPQAKKFQEEPLMGLQGLGRHD